jgi:hypothetical protein
MEDLQRAYEWLVMVDESCAEEVMAALWNAVSHRCAGDDAQSLAHFDEAAEVLHNELSYKFEWLGMELDKLFRELPPAGTSENLECL